MPELPEVEVTRLGFASAIAGALLVSVRLGKPLRWPLGCDAASLVGQRVHAVRGITHQHTARGHVAICLKVTQRKSCSLAGQRDEV